MEKQESSLRRRSTEPSAWALSAPSGCPHHWPYIRVASFRSLDCLLKDVVCIYIIHIIHIELVHIKYVIMLYIQACLYIVFYTRTQHKTFVSDKKKTASKKDPIVVEQGPRCVTLFAMVLNQNLEIWPDYSHPLGIAVQLNGDPKPIDRIQN